MAEPTRGPWGIEREISGWRDGCTIYSLGEEEYDGFRAPKRQVAQIEFRSGSNTGTTEDGEPIFGEDEANAHLISAAPELLEAAKRALRLYEDPQDLGSEVYDSAAAQLREAIERAEGERK